MDFFGIGHAIKSAAQIYFTTSRATGRTLSLVESVKDGDRIWFSSSKEARRVEALIKERNINVECFACSPVKPYKIFERGTAQGRSILDHSWVEEFYLNALDKVNNELSQLEKDTSGFGAVHRDTRRKAIELHKFPHF